MQSDEIFDLLMFKSQIEYERRKIVENENKHIGSMKRYMSKRQPFADITGTTARLMQEKYR